MGIPEFPQGNFPNRSLVSAFRVKRLIPSTIMEVLISGVFAMFWGAISFAKVIPAAFHFGLFRKGDMGFPNGIGVVIVVTGFRKQKDVFMFRGGSIFNG